MSDGTPIGALAVRIGADATDLIEAFEKSGKAAKDLGSTMGSTIKSITAFGASAAAAGTAVLLFVKGIANTADEMGKLAQKVGVSVESLSGLAYAARLSNLSVESLGLGLKQLSRYMVENNIQAVSVEEQLLRIADEFAKSADGANKTAVAMKYFGKSGADLIPFLNEGRAGIEKLREEAAKMGLVVSKDAAEAAAKFNDNLTKLKASSEGLAIHLGGPLVKALGDAAGAMLDAEKKGGSFLDKLAAGFRALVVGGDDQEWARRFVNTTDIYLNALDRMDKARSGRSVESLSASERAIYERAKAEAAKAKAELDTMQKIKPIIAPEEEKKKEEKKKQMAAPFDAKAAEEQARREEDAREESVKTAAEAAQLMDDQRQKDLERQRAARALDLQETDDYNQMNIEQLKALQDERIRILMEAADMEQEVAIQKGQEILNAEREGERTRLEMGYKHRELDLASAKTFFGHMSALMNTKSKELFAIGKAAAIAETIINTHAAAMAAYKSLAGISIVGPALGAAAAGAAIIAGMAQVQSIRSQSFGGGGSPSGTFAANPTTGQASGTPGGDVGVGTARGPDTFLSIHGDDIFSGETLRRLITRLNETTKNGGRLVLADDIR